ncbi:MULTISPECIES: hypothetical protein [Methylobacterium]|uniref:Uncharacterized protein n=1 Tax=Methylobacterium thuringiense TaxID=1003091 RepID=A0ABQ4TS82_9HYPH|nr:MULTISPECIES: hypothetical protein [Methylobacterium]TXN22820.1 hypothetical protein FV217_09380 [Methylobacterium sp. WL9]GJE57022.1 hypothetical protein EKPJFOCH_3532 [Methylobacterium thuringiense]
MTARIIVGAALGLALSTTAFAQSYNAPAGIPAATAPGGFEGRAAERNIEAYNGRYARPRDGQVSVDGVYTTGSVRGSAAQRGR